MNLSPHFTYEELTFSQAALRLGIDNKPPDAAVANLTDLAKELLEPIRALLGVPIHIDSGFRSFRLNQDIGGANNSAHLEGRAADIIPIGMDLRLAFDKIRAAGLPIDQIILECNAWIHVSIAPFYGAGRNQALLAEGSPGHWTYVNA